MNRKWRWILTYLLPIILLSLLRQAVIHPAAAATAAVVHPTQQISPTLLLEPQPDSIQHSYPVFHWSQPVTAGVRFTIEIATDPHFNTIFYSKTLTTTADRPLLGDLNYRQDYYWRVLTEIGGTTEQSAVFAFFNYHRYNNCTTAQSPTPFPFNNGFNQTMIPFTGSSVMGVAVNIQGTDLPLDALTFNLRSPAGTNVNLMTPTCSAGSSNVVWSDYNSNPHGSWSCPVATSFVDNYRAQAPLTNFDFEDANGLWTLEILSADGPGLIDGWALEICEPTISDWYDLDFSDLPASYGVAAHGIDQFEPQPPALGNLNDLETVTFANGTDDGSDDGITFSGDFNGGGTGKVTAVISNAPGDLACWFDWNQDQTFTNADELANVSPLSIGSNLLTFVVPAAYDPSTDLDGLQARCRFYAYGGPAVVSPWGVMGLGEVEDYSFSPPTCAPLTEPAVTAAISNGTDLDLSWTAVADNYDLHHDTVPYQLTAGNLISQTTAVAYIDLDVVGNTAVNHYYYLIGNSSCGARTTARHTGAFDFAITPGSP